MTDSTVQQSNPATTAEPTSIAGAMRRQQAMYPPLEQVTKPNLTTRELSYYSDLAEQTWRAKACFETFPDGLRPLRLCGRLAWPTAGAKKFLGVPA